MCKILLYPADILKQECSRVEDIGDAREIAQSLDVALRLTKAQGHPAHALAAPQIGLSARVFVVDTTANGIKQSVFINPEWVYKSIETHVLTESCMSLPGVKVGVRRHTMVAIKARDVYGNPFEATYEGLEAQILQHEMNHLDGITVFNHAKPGTQRKLMQAAAKNLHRRMRANR